MIQWNGLESGGNLRRPLFRGWHCSRRPGISTEHDHHEFLPFVRFGNGPSLSITIDVSGLLAGKLSCVAFVRFWTTDCAIVAVSPGGVYVPGCLRPISSRSMVSYIHNLKGVWLAGVGHMREQGTAVAIVKHLILLLHQWVIVDR